MAPLSDEMVLIIWTIAIFIYFIFIGIALIKLIKTELLDAVSKLIWFPIIFLIPIIGAISFLIYHRNLEKQNKMVE